jgi:FHA domain
MDLWSQRSKANIVCLKDPMASRHHAKLEIIQERHCYFVDLNSRNGSLINGQRVTQPVLLKHGDYISIGNTFLLFQHRLVTLTGIPFPHLSKQVLMLQASAVQGKIWQEILLSQKASVVWEVSSSELKKLIALNATANTLPNLFLIDKKAYRVKLYDFCNWCRQSYPQLKIFLTDSLQAQIPDRERQAAIQQGCLNVFPAFPKSNLVYNATQIADRVNEVLRAMDGSPIHLNQLLPTLKNLEDLMKQGASFCPLFEDELDSELDIPTALSALAPEQKKLHKNRV